MPLTKTEELYLRKLANPHGNPHTYSSRGGQVWSTYRPAETGRMAIREVLEALTAKGYVTHTHSGDTDISRLDFYKASPAGVAFAKEHMAEHADNDDELFAATLVVHELTEPQVEVLHAVYDGDEPSLITVNITLAIIALERAQLLNAQTGELTETGVLVVQVLKDLETIRDRETRISPMENMSIRRLINTISPKEWAVLEEALSDRDPNPQGLCELSEASRRTLSNLIGKCIYTDLQCLTPIGEFVWSRMQE